MMARSRARPNPGARASEKRPIVHYPQSKFTSVYNLLAARLSSSLRLGQSLCKAFFRGRGRGRGRGGGGVATVNHRPALVVEGRAVLFGGSAIVPLPSSAAAANARHASVAAAVAAEAVVAARSRGPARRRGGGGGPRDRARYTRRGGARGWGGGGRGSGRCSGPGAALLLVSGARDP
jgi:hypothetical protein